MSTKYHLQTKTLGPRAAQLLIELNELRRSTFTLADVGSITGLSAAAVSFFLLLVVDNVCARVKWPLALRSAWLVTLVLGFGNILILSVLKK